jgi:hypothetical protein
MPDLTNPEGACAFEFLHVLPQPGTPGLDIEQHIQFPPFHGYPDVLEPPDADGIPTVDDHKTCGSFRYAIESLKDDTQAAIYAHFAFNLYHAAPAVDLRWNYVTRSRPKLHAVHQRVTRADITPTIERARATALRMAQVTARTALELPPNPIACEQYGGCQYRSLCNLTAQDKLTALLAQETRHMSALTPDSFLAQVAAQVGGTPLPPPPPAGNPWDGLPPTHVTATHYCPDGANWVLKAPAPLPPPPPVQAFGPPPPPPPPVAPPAINPPPIAPTNGAPPPAPVVAAEPAKRRPGRPPKVAGSVAQAEGTGGYAAVADALRALADAVEAL